MVVFVMLFGLLQLAVQFYLYIVLAAAILSWLLAFNVISLGKPWVRSVYGFLTAVTEPALRPIRRLLPATGSIDFSPLVLILGLMIVSSIFGGLSRAFAVAAT